MPESKCPRIVISGEGSILLRDIKYAIILIIINPILSSRYLGNILKIVKTSAFAFLTGVSTEKNK